MAMIKCSECGKDISDKAAACVGCGAPIFVAGETQVDASTTSTSTVTGDLNGDGKVDFEDFKIALSRSKKYASEKVDDAIKFGKEKLQSAKERDAAAVEKLAKEFGDIPPVDKTESQIARDKFKAALENTIDVRFADIMRAKKEPDVYLTYIDAQILTASVRNIFKRALSVSPPQIEASLMLSEAVLAPSAKEKANLIKAAVGVGGGTAGIGIVVAAVGTALNWGASAWGIFTAAFTTTHIAGPIGWGVAGLSLAAIAGYFASTSNNQTDTERFLRVLKGSTARAVDAIWEHFESDLSKTVSQAVSVDSGSAK
jgi:hypothetical protein